MNRFVRLLPVTIVAAALMLTVRLGEVWRGVDAAIAAEKAVEEPAAPAEAEVEAAEASEDAHAADAATEAEGHDAAAMAEEEGPAALTPEQLTGEEMKILQGLAHRRTEIEKLEAELEVREDLLAAAEGRVEAKIAELDQLRGQIAALIRQYNEQEDAEIQSLVKIYETMKPKDAARILQDLELDVLLSIMERMKSRSSAPILAAMDGSRAREVTAQLAQRLALDMPTGPEG